MQNNNNKNVISSEISGIVLLLFALLGWSGFPTKLLNKYLVGFFFGELGFLIYAFLIVQAIIMILNRRLLFHGKRASQVGLVVLFIGIILFFSMTENPVINWVGKEEGEGFVGIVSRFFHNWSIYPNPDAILSTGLIGTLFVGVLAPSVHNLILYISTLAIIFIGFSLVFTGSIYALYHRGFILMTKSDKPKIKREEVVVSKEEIKHNDVEIGEEKPIKIKTKKLIEDDYDMPFLNDEHKAIHDEGQIDEMLNPFIESDGLPGESKFVKVLEKPKSARDFIKDIADDYGIEVNDEDFQEEEEEHIELVKQPGLDDLDVEEEFEDVAIEATNVNIKADMIKSEDELEDDFYKQFDDFSSNAESEPEAIYDEFGDEIEEKLNRIEEEAKIEVAKKDVIVPDKEEIVEVPKVVEAPKPKPKKIQKYEAPKLNEVFSEENAQLTNSQIAEAEDKKILLNSTLEQFNVKASVDQYHVGPSVTKFEIKLEIGTRVSKITALQDDLKLALAAKDIRIEAPIPGKSAVGIEIPNQTRSMVHFANIIEKIPKDKSDDKLVVALGKDIMGEVVFCDLAKMPHLLIAGATGSGKSVCVNTILSSIIMRTSPAEVRMVLVDPKKVELAIYGEIPHLLAPVISDAKKANLVLKQIVIEMERRYTLFEESRTRNIAGYNKKHPHDKLPFLLVVIDELADLMLVAAKEVEESIQRITQMARAAGIHLILATQRPSTDVITGTIKANVPSRMSFAVSSSIDSRTILDQTGAEKLIGRGDMLYSPIGQLSPVRVQGAFIDDDEVQDICYQAAKQWNQEFDEDIVNPPTADVSDEGFDMSDEPLYGPIRAGIIDGTLRASTSGLQRKFSIGYNKAAKIIDALEAEGVIGPANGSKPRDVLVEE